MRTNLLRLLADPLLLCSRNGFIDFRGGFFSPLVERRAIGEFLFENQFFGDLETVAGERFAFDLVGNVTGVIVLTVSAQAQDRSDDKLRRPPGARALDRAADHVQTRGEIGAIDIAAFEAVALRLRGEIVAGKLALVRRGVGVMIVRRHHHERHLLDRGDVHPFVEGAGRGPAFADRR